MTGAQAQLSLNLKAEPRQERRGMLHTVHSNHNLCATHHSARAAPAEDGQTRLPHHTHQPATAAATATHTTATATCATATAASIPRCCCRLPAATAAAAAHERDVQVVLQRLIDGEEDGVTGNLASHGGTQATSQTPGRRIQQKQLQEQLLEPLHQCFAEGGLL